MRGALLLAIVLFPMGVRGDGFVWFSTRDVRYQVDAPATQPDGTTGLGPCFRARLALVGQDGSVSGLFPETNFQTPGVGGAAALSRYVNPVAVRVPGRNPGDTVRLRMEVFDGEHLYRQTADFQLQLGTEAAPAPLPADLNVPTPISQSAAGGVLSEVPVRLDLYSNFLLLRAARSTGVRVEYSDDLVTWTPNPGCSQDIEIGHRTRFYRVVYSGP